MISTGTDDLLRLARERADFLEAQVRRLRAERTTMRDCISHHLACECREALLAELKAEVDQLRARVAQLEGRDPLDVFRPEEPDR